MARKSLTKASVEALKYDFSKWADRTKPAPRQVEYDGKQRNFGCRVTPQAEAGSLHGKSYVISFRFNGRPDIMSLGRAEDFRGPDEAREKAAGLLHELNHKNINPRSHKTRLSNAPTIGALWAIYTRDHLSGLSANLHRNLLGKNGDRGWWGNHIAPEIQHLKPLQVSSSDTIRLHDKITRKAGKTTANRCIQRLHHFFEWSQARDEHLFPPEWKNPTDKVTMHKEEARSHFLNVEQMQTLFDALALHPDPYFHGFIGLLLFTAARKNEVLKLKWSDIDLPGRVAYVKRTKNGTPLAMPLQPAAVRLLESLPRMAHSEWVFPSGHKPSLPMYEPRRAFKRLLKSLKLPDQTTFHDLRRSVGCALAAAGRSEVEISAFLNNTASVSAKHYIKLVGEAKRKIADAHALIFQDKDVVVSLPAQS